MKALRLLSCSVLSFSVATKVLQPMPAFPHSLILKTEQICFSQIFQRQNTLFQILVLWRSGTWFPTWYYFHPWWNLPVLNRTHSLYIEYSNTVSTYTSRIKPYQRSEASQHRNIKRLIVSLWKQPNSLDAIYPVLQAIKRSLFSNHQQCFFSPSQTRLDPSVLVRLDLSRSKIPSPNALPLLCQPLFAWCMHHLNCLHHPGRQLLICAYECTFNEHAKPLKRRCIQNYMFAKPIEVLYRMNK